MGKASKLSAERRFVTQEVIWAYPVNKTTGAKDATLISIPVGSELILDTRCRVAVSGGMYVIQELSFVFIAKFHGDATKNYSLAETAQPVLVTIKEQPAAIAKKRSSKRASKK